MNSQIYDPILIYGDFFEEYKKHLSPRTVNLFLADPPYGIFTNETDLTGVEDPEINLDALGIVLDYLLSENGTVLLFCDLNLLVKLKKSLTGFEFRFEYVLYKPNGSPTHKSRPLSNIEYVAVLKRKGTKASDLSFHPYASGKCGEPYIKKNYSRNHSTRKSQKRKIDKNITGHRYIKQSLKMKGKCNLNKDERTPHPFQKSEETLRTLIRVHSNPNNLICDGFVGSGSTLVAAYKENRNSIGFEIDKKWYKIAKDRIKDETKKIKIFK